MRDTVTTDRTQSEEVRTGFRLMPALTISATPTRRSPPAYGAAGLYRHPSIAVGLRPIPNVPPGTVRVAVEWVGICGSDIHAVQRDAEGWSRSSVPAGGWDREGGLTLGHEFAGRVVEVGPGTLAPPRGALVTSDSLLPCRDCVTCVADPNCCPEAELLGFQVPGAFAEFAVVPVASLHSLDPLLPLFGEATARVGCLAEPLGVAAKAVAELEANLRRGMPRSLLVLGGGPLGTMVAAIARIQGWQPVVVAEPSALRRRRAAAFANAVIDLPTLEDPLKMRGTFGQGPAAVVDACGAAGFQSFLLPRPRGVYLLLARTSRKRELPEDHIITREITIAGCRGHVRHVPTVLHLMAEGRLDPDAFVTQRLDGLEEVAHWLAEPSRFDSELKVVARVAPGSGGRAR